LSANLLSVAAVGPSSGGHPVGRDGSTAGGSRARVQHVLGVLYREERTHGSGRRAARAFGISQTLWSRALSGERWMGETVTAALLQAILEG
jgi:hypothetical protein